MFLNLDFIVLSFCRDPKERGEIETICLKIFNQLLLLLDIEQNAISPAEQSAAQRHPGFEILLRILCGSRLLQSVRLLFSSTFFFFFFIPFHFFFFLLQNLIYSTAFADF
jgi:hypothetical protein